jgi:hypothetical protein
MQAALKDIVCYLSAEHEKLLLTSIVRHARAREGNLQRAADNEPANLLPAELFYGLNKRI